MSWVEETTDNVSGYAYKIRIDMGKDLNLELLGGELFLTQYEGTEEEAIIVLPDRKILDSLIESLMLLRGKVE